MPSFKGSAITLQKNCHVTLFWCYCISETMGNKAILFSDVTIPHKSVTITL